MENGLLVLDIGGTSIKRGYWVNDELVTLDGVRTPETWDEMKSMIKKWCQEVPFDLKGLAISAPGSVDVESGIIYGLSAIPYIHRFPIRDELAGVIGKPVSIQNDANCVALAEVWRGNAKDVDDSAFMILGTGVGGAIVNNRKLHPGAHLFGGEYGNSVINFKTGETLSQLASPVNMATRFNEKNKTNLSGEEIFIKSDSGDVHAKEVIEDMYQAIAIGIYNLAVTFDPDRILIGGGISRRAGLVSEIKKFVDRILISHEFTDLKVDIQACHFQDEANLVGAVYQYQLNNG
ncbi:ROK family protein [Dellaglioa sp. L3N]